MLQFAALVSSQHHSFFCVSSIAEKNLTENSTLETEADGQRQIKEKETDNEEEEVSSQPAPNTPKRRKPLDTSEWYPKSALHRQSLEFH